MRPGTKKTFLAALVAALFVSVLLNAAPDAQLHQLGFGASTNQSIAFGASTNMTSVMYFEPPNDQHVRLRLTGAEMTPLPQAMYEVKKMKIEQYALGGKLEVVAEAPNCTYAPEDEIASSPGHLDVKLLDGKISVQGEGFLYREADQILMISNQVHTVIKTGTWTLNTP